MPLPLQGLTVVAVEQAVAAPFCSSRLADAGARVIKIERPEGDFARQYDHLVHGESAYFVWLNRGKESVVIDLATDAGRKELEALIASADVLLQNLKPGAMDKLGCADDTAFAEKLMTDALVAVVPGSGFGAPDHMRLSFACSMETLEKAVARIRAVLA